MRRITSLICEEILLISVYVLMIIKFRERMPPNEAVWILGIIIGRNIIVAKAIEYLIEHNIAEQGKFFYNVFALLLSFLLIGAVFLADFWAVHYFADLPATTELLIIIGCGYACCHLLLSSVLDNLMGVKRNFLTAFTIKDDDGDLEDEVNENDF